MLHNKIAICIRTDDVTQSCARTFDEQFGRALSDTCRVRAATREDAGILGIHFLDVQNAFVVLLKTKKYVIIGVQYSTSTTLRTKNWDTLQSGLLLVVERMLIIWQHFSGSVSCFR